MHILYVTTNIQNRQSGRLIGRQTLVCAMLYRKQLNTAEICLIPLQYLIEGYMSNSRVYLDYKNVCLWS